MTVIGKTHNQYGKVLGKNLGMGGKYLGSAMSTHHTTHVHHSQDQHVQKSSLERTRHIPLDGHEMITHGLGQSRKAWQRKKNH